MDDGHPAWLRLQELTREGVDGRAVLERWCAERVQEDLHLDFKTAGSSFANASERKTLAKAISAFSNSAGGLVVWGVRARKRSGEDVDAADAIDAIPDVAAAMSRLQEYTSQATSPVASEVTHHLVYATADGSGAIATLIPASDTGPHMARLGEQRYYKRAGGSTYMLEHFDLEDMFGRRATPVLECEVELASVAIDEHPTTWEKRINCAAYLLVKNTGRGLARFVEVEVSCTRESPSAYRDTGWANTGSTHRTLVERELILHAGAETKIGHMHLIRWLSGGRGLADRQHTDISYVVRAMGMRPRLGTLSVTMAAIHEAYKAGTARVQSSSTPPALP
ncbi:MAG: ATP-binding protein [Phycisphaerales bacterium]|nr:ATP-binding protein [Phycisphaerales bacterium]